MKKLNKKAVTAIVLAGLITVTATVGSTWAYFTDKEKANNVVTTGNVNITLTDELNGETINDFVPNQKISDVVTVQNVGKNDAFLRLKFSYNGLTAEEIESTFSSAGFESKEESFESENAAQLRINELAEKNIIATLGTTASTKEVIDFNEKAPADRIVNYWLTSAETMAFIPQITENADGTKTVKIHRAIPNLYNSGVFSFSYLGVDWTFNYASGGQTPSKTFTLQENQKLIVLDLSTGKEISVEDYTKFVNRSGFSYKIDTKSESYGYKWTVVTTEASTSYTVSYNEPANYAGVNTAFTKADSTNEDGSIYYYYNGVLEAGTDAVSVLDTIKIPAKWGNKYADKTFSFEITAEAVQADFVEVSDGVYANDAMTAFAYIDGEGIEIEAYNN